MFLFLIGISCLGVSGIVALLTNRYPKCSTIVGSVGAVVGCIMGLIPAIVIFWGGKHETLHYEWEILYGTFAITLDGLSAFFLIIIFFVSALAAIFGSQYLYAYRHQKRLGVSWFFFNLLVGAMAIVVVARDGILFLVAWEMMSLASFFLVTFENKKSEVEKAGYVYFVAMHFSAAFLLTFFLLIDHLTGSMNFMGGSLPAHVSPLMTNILFVLACIGFGIKAGFIPFHVWLPEAHPSAPSHISAVMSGVMIKTGIYGLIRAFMLLGPPALWWAWMLIGVGFCSGILGILYAIAQHDLKRLLAYSTVENIGIIVMGLGLGLLGWSYHSPLLTVLGFLGALLHVMNHALFKGLLFLGAGSILHATGTRTIDRLGGLIKSMPWSASVFLIGAVAICGLPPLNGFMSEFLIYSGAFKGIIETNSSLAFSSLVIVIGLTLIGGLAIACFTKVVGIVFLGEPRSESVETAHEAGLLMRIPMIILAVHCLLVGLFFPQIVKWMLPVITQITGLNIYSVNEYMIPVIGTFAIITRIFVCLLILLLTALLFRKMFGSGHKNANLRTWNCGYTRYSSRMQYTAASFTQPIMKFFSWILRKKRHFSIHNELFPQETSFRTSTRDVFMNDLYGSIFENIKIIFSKLRWLQYGRVHFYVLYIALTSICLLIWYMGLSL